MKILILQKQTNKKNFKKNTFVYGFIENLKNDIAQL